MRCVSSLRARGCLAGAAPRTVFRWPSRRPVRAPGNWYWSSCRPARPRSRVWAAPRWLVRRLELLAGLDQLYVVVEAAAVAEQLLEHGFAALIEEAGKPAVDGVVEGQLTPRYGLQHHRGRHHLGDAADLEGVRGAQPARWLAAGQSEHERPCLLTDPDADDDARRGVGVDVERLLDPGDGFVDPAQVSGCRGGCRAGFGARGRRRCSRSRRRTTGAGREGRPTTESGAVIFRWWHRRPGFVCGPLNPEPGARFGAGSSRRGRRFEAVEGQPRALASRGPRIASAWGCCCAVGRGTSDVRWL